MKRCVKRNSVVKRYIMQLFNLKTLLRTCLMAWRHLLCAAQQLPEAGKALSNVFRRYTHSKKVEINMTSVFELKKQRKKEEMIRGRQEKRKREIEEEMGHWLKRCHSAGRMHNGCWIGHRWVAFTEAASLSDATSLKLNLWSVFSLDAGGNVNCDNAIETCQRGMHRCLNGSKCELHSSLGSSSGSKLLVCNDFYLLLRTWCSLRFSQSLLARNLKSKNIITFQTMFGSLTLCISLSWS